LGGRRLVAAVYGTASRGKRFSALPPNQSRNKLPHAEDAADPHTIEDPISCYNYNNSLCLLRMNVMTRTTNIPFLLLCFAAAVAHGAEADLAQPLAAIRAVGPEAAGHREAAAAWQSVAAADTVRLPEILAGMDSAGPLAANWIATAAQAVVERQRARGGSLPAADLEQFALDRHHASRGRELAYELLLGIDPQAESRLVSGMLDDPCLAFRYLAVARLIAEADAGAKAGEKEGAVAVFRRALTAARDPQQARVVAERLKKLGDNVDLAKQLGYIVQWKLIGPFDNTGRKGLDTVYPPEKERKLDAVYDGKTDKVRWVDFVSEDQLGKIDFFKPFGRHNDVAGYAVTDFVASKRHEVELRLSAGNATKLWIGGRLINEHPVYHSGSGMDQYIDRVTLEPGHNWIMVKVCQNEQTQDWAQQWQFQLRVCDLLGNPVLSADRE
jgi:hypothetical protein